MTVGKLLPAPVDLLPQGVVPCLPATQAGRAVRNYCPHPRCFCWLSSLWLQLKCVMKDVVSTSPPPWTMICFFQSAVKALVVSSKVFKLILTRLQSLTGNTQSCTLSSFTGCSSWKLRVYSCIFAWFVKLLSTLVILAVSEPHSF